MVGYLNQYHHLSLTYKRLTYFSPVVPAFPVALLVLHNGGHLHPMNMLCRFHYF